MRTFFKVIARMFAAFFAIFFVLTAVFVLVFSNLGSRMFNPNFYKNALEEMEVYEKLPGLVGRMLTLSMTYNPCAENPVTCEEISPELQSCYEQALGVERYIALASEEAQPTEGEEQQIQSCLDRFGSTTTGTDEEEGSSEDGGPPAFFQNMSAEDWEAVLVIVFPPEELQDMTESVLDGVFAYLDGEVDQVTLSMVALKDRLTGSGGDDLIQQIITAQPDCTPEELPVATGVLKGEKTVICNTPEELLPQAVSVLRDQLDDALAGISDEIEVIKPAVSRPVESSGDGPLGSDPSEGFRLFRMILRLLPLLPFAFLMLVTLFGVRSLKSWFRWWGIPFTFAGFIGVGLGISISPLLAWLWTAFVTPRLPAILPPEAVALGRDLAGYFAHDIALRILLQSLLLLVIGLAAWIGSFYLKKKAVTPQPPPPVVPVG